VKKRTAKDIVKENVDAWGEGKPRYQIDIDDLRILLADPNSTKVCIDHDNGDGTYFSEVQNSGRFFACSSKEQV